MSGTRQKSSTQIDAEVLAAVRKLANADGRQSQALVEEALEDLIEKYRNARPRPQTMAAYLASHEEYGSLYKKLAE